MSKPAALLIGKLTHVQKEWQDCASFAELKVGIFDRWRRKTMLTRAKTFSGSTRAEFLEECEKGSYNDVVALYRSNESTSVS